jgi:hypothetical protein
MVGVDHHGRRGVRQHQARRLIGFAREIGAIIVAEGIETAAPTSNWPSAGSTCARTAWASTARRSTWPGARSPSSSSDDELTALLEAPAEIPIRTF